METKKPKKSVAPSLSELYENKINVFKNAEVFEIEHNPSELVARTEAAEIFDRTISFMKSRISQHLFIYGGCGSGKTAYAKYIKSQVEDLVGKRGLDFNVEYINCRFFKDLWKIPAHICHVQPGDFDPKEILENELDRNMLLILDEIDVASNPSDFFYFISRFQEIQSSNKYKIMLLIISNKKEWDKTLDSPTRSSLALKKIEFKRYNQNQIKEILEKRILDGLVNPNIITNEILENLSKKTVESGSDLRIGLRATRMVINRLSGDVEIGKEAVLLIYNEALKEIQLERIGDLKNEKFLILYALFKSKNQNSREVWDAYEDLSYSMKIKPWSYASFFHYTNELRDQDFIDIQKGKKEGQRNITVNQLIPKIREEVIEEEFENRQMTLSKG